MDTGLVLRGNTRALALFVAPEILFLIFIFLFQTERRVLPLFVEPEITFLNIADKNVKDMFNNKP